MHYMLRILIVLLFISKPFCIAAQTSNPATTSEKLINSELDTIQSLQQTATTEKFVSQVSKKLNRVQRKLDKQTLKALKKYYQEEAKLKEKLLLKDSTATEEIFSGGMEKMKELQKEFESVPDEVMTKVKTEYDAYMDTLQSTFKFLTGKLNVANSKTKELQQKLTSATSKLNIMQGKMQKADEIKKYLKERRQYLKQHLEKFGMAKQLKKLEKVNYYYNAYFTEYKSILKDRKKLEQKAMTALYNTPFFKKFVSDNSLLASLFRLPGAANGSANTIAGNIASQPQLVQTRASVQQAIQTTMATGGPNAMSQVRQQMQAAQAEFSKLKDRIAKFGSADEEIPSFKPNSQKTKQFSKRLEYGANVQFGKANNYLPATSNIGLSLGYKINDKSSAGIAAAYTLGLGSGWNNIKITSNGVGLRSYLDWKIKGNFFISGGYEQNYYSQFKNIQQLKEYASWKSSGLIGVSKKVAFKATKSIKVQLLYDFLSYQKMPVTQPFIFRTGINWK